MEITWFLPGELEIRRRGGGSFLSGTFRYGRTATISDRGRVRKERIDGRAFGWQLREFERVQEELSQALGEAFEEAARVSALRQELERRNVHILAGHDFNKPLGSMLAGSARVVDGDDALRFEVDLPDAADQPSHMRDAVAMVRSGLAGGISPGFRVPPRNAVPDAETLEPERGNPGVDIRVIRQAVLYELSIVTRPAYAETSVDVRAEDFPELPDLSPRTSTLWL